LARANPFAISSLAVVEEARGNFAGAESARQRLLDIRPTYEFGHNNLGIGLLKQGDLNGALLEFQRETNEKGRQQGLALVYYALGRKAESDAALAELLKDPSNLLSVVAEVYAYRGQPDQAMLWLERAFAQRDGNLYAIKSDPLFDSLNTDQRYKALLRKMNLPEA
jgi:tetratricopeptide (TPR) repeat protein